jgi:DNA polymerase
MEQQGQLAASKMVTSLTNWWELAGVDSAVGEMPINWLEEEPMVPPLPDQTASVPVVKDAPDVQPKIDWPAGLEDLKVAILRGDSLPGNDFGNVFVSPSGIAANGVMVISDLPDEDETAAAVLGSGKTGILLTRMLAAIDIDLRDCYWTALATTIPPTGEVPENALKELAAFCQHQMAIVRPSALILLGSSASKALLDQELMKARQNLGNINHDGRNMAVLTTFHPRTLIARPALKAQAWKDLQMFAKRAGS